MKVIEVMKTMKYFIIAAVSSAAFAAAYLYTQVLGIVQNLDIWFSIVPAINLVLFIVISVLFGVTLSYQIYSWRQPRTCAINKRAIGTGSAGTFAGFLVAQCPACASLGALFLPSSVFLTVFMKYGTLINITSIGLLMFTLHYLGAFRKE